MKKSIEKREIKNPLLKTLVLGTASGFGTGFAPWAPGTAGSLVGIPLGLYLLNFSTWISFVILTILFVIFTGVAHFAGHHWGERDSSKIVIDEVIGQAIALMGLSHFKGQELETPTQVFYVLICFGLFRLFDITKPIPARNFDRHNSALGVMGDDVVAGIYAALVFRFLITL